MYTIHILNAFNSVFLLQYIYTEPVVIVAPVEKNSTKSQLNTN
jgi:hypothetical protein